MRILNPVTGEIVEVKVPAPSARLQERADAKATRIAAKLAARSRISELVAETADTAKTPT